MAENSNVEEFLIKFILDDKKAIKGLKSISKIYDNINKSVRESSRVSEQAARRKTASTQKIIDKDKERLRIAEKLIKAEDRFQGQARYRTVLQENPVFAKQQSRDYLKGLTAFLAAGTIEEKQAGLAQMRQATNTISDYSKKINEAKRASIGLRTAQSGLVDSTRNMIRAYASLFTAFAGTSAVIRTGQQFEQMRAGMEAATDSAEEARQTLRFLRMESMRLGFDLPEASKAFVRLRAVIDEDTSVEALQHGFTSLMEASTVFQLSMDDTIGTIRAIQQMFSKAGIMSEEFKVQLGDRLPIAMKALELSTGKTAKELLKMMKNGELGSEYIIPFMDALGDLANRNNALSKALDTSNIAQRRFVNTMKIASDVIYSGDMAKGYVELLNTLKQFFDENQHALKGLGRLFGLFFRAIALGLKVLLPILDSFLFVLGEVVKGWNLIFGTNVGKAVLGIGLIAGAIKLLNTEMMILGRRLLYALALFDEILSFFVKGRVNVIEDLIGYDISTEGFEKMKGGGNLQNKVHKIVDPNAVSQNPIVERLFDFISGNKGFMDTIFPTSSMSKPTVINSPTYQVTVQNPPGADEKRTAELVKRELEKHNDVVERIFVNDYIGGQ